MEKHYYIELDTLREFAVRYGTPGNPEANVKTFHWLWAAKVYAAFHNRKLTKLREFNDRQSELFGGGSLELPPDETQVLEVHHG